ncbi:MAG: YhcH/YjgK/YiaL family protein [Clostridia bacterium]|nr:YhcH/YjgK/YiaL family protein [Clostridia bacterium]
MIIDNMKNCEKYFSVHKNFAKAFDFIQKVVEENYAPGKYEIDGVDVYANVLENTTKDDVDCKFEGHQNYIDIQFIASGVEVMQIADISKMTVKSEYNPEKDVQFYENFDKATTAVIESGEYGIFFPHDIHKPCMSLNGNKTAVKKIVVKVKV